jgi:hypothetical protein
MPSSILSGDRARTDALKEETIQKRKKTWRSAAAHRLVELAGGVCTVEDAIVRLAQEYLQGVECPPTDLDSLSVKLGITGFEAADLAGSGELRKDGKGLRVFYSTYLSTERRRFTIAHEMGHAVLEHTGPRTPHFGKELERLCDMFAVELLMPRQMFINCAKGEISTQRILDIARRFRTSVTTTGLRYAELCRVSVFAFQDSRVIWGKGIVRPGPRTTVNEALRPLIQKALDGDPNSDEVFLNHRGSLSRWRFECRPLARGKYVLCLLMPVEKLSVGAATETNG